MKNDILKTIVSLSLILGGFFMFYHFKDSNYLLGLGGLLLMFLTGFFTIFTTEYFKKLQQRLGDIKYELLLVIWPKGNDAFKSFTVVIIFSIVFAGIIWGLDTQLGNIYKEIIIK
jgi:preprotein translocase SecE subunit